MKKKIVLGALCTSAFIAAGCAMNSPQEETVSKPSENTQQVQDSTNSSITDTVLFTSYPDLFKDVTDGDIQTPQQILDFFSKDRTKDEELTVEEYLDDNGELEELGFTSGSNSLNVFFYEGTINSISLSLNFGRITLSNNAMADTKGSSSIQIEFNSNDEAFKAINKLNPTSVEKKYIDLVKLFPNDEPISLSEVEKELGHTFTESDRVYAGDDSTDSYSCGYEVVSEGATETIDVYVEDKDVVTGLSYSTGSTPGTHKIHSYGTDRLLSYKQHDGYVARNNSIQIFSLSVEDQFKLIDELF